MSPAATAVISLVLILLLLLSGFFSAAETAYTGFSQARMKSLAKSDKNAALVLKMTENFGTVLTSLLIGNNLVNIAATTLSAVLFTAHFGDWGATISTAVMTILVLVFGEVTPKTLAKERPEEFAMFSARAVYACTVVFRPFCKLFALWRRAVCRIFGLDGAKRVITGDELKIIISDAADGGTLPKDEEEIMENALLYGGKRVASYMIPAQMMTCIEMGEPVGAIARIFEGSGHTVIPVTRGGLQNVAGVIFQTEFYKMLAAGRTDIDEIIRPVLRCKPTDSLGEVFVAMQSAKKSFAIVCDGARVEGLITANDIVRELVGKVW